MNKMYLGLLLPLLIFMNGCGPTTTEGAVKILDIPAAENLHYTTDDRLFVTGGEGLYEIVPDVSGFQAIQKHTNCNATGIAELQNWLFFNCASFIGDVSSLWAYNLTSEAVIQVTELPEFNIANGMDSLGNDTLFIANFDVLFLEPGSIGKLTIDFSGATPTVSTFDPLWGAAADGVINPNGIDVEGDRLYFADPGAIRYAVIENGNLQSVVTLNVPSEPIYDDLDVSAGYVLAGSFLDGLIYKATENCWANTPNYFRSVSSVRFGRGPFLGTLLVTDRLGSQLGSLDLALITALPCS